VGAGIYVEVSGGRYIYCIEVSGGRIYEIYCKLSIIDNRAYQWRSGMAVSATIDVCVRNQRPFRASRSRSTSGTGSAVSAPEAVESHRARVAKEASMVLLF